MKCEPVDEIQHHGRGTNRTIILQFATCSITPTTPELPIRAGNKITYTQSLFIHVQLFLVVAIQTVYEINDPHDSNE